MSSNRTQLALNALNSAYRVLNEMPKSGVGLDALALGLLYLVAGLKEMNNVLDETYTKLQEVESLMKRQNLWRQ